MVKSLYAQVNEVSDGTAVIVWSVTLEILATGRSTTVRNIRWPMLCGKLLSEVKSKKISFIWRPCEHHCRNLASGYECYCASGYDLDVENKRDCHRSKSFYASMAEHTKQRLFGGNRSSNQRQIQPQNTHQGQYSRRFQKRPLNPPGVRFRPRQSNPSNPNLSPIYHPRRQFYR